MQEQKGKALFCLVLLLLLILPPVLNAGGDFQERMKQKLSSPKKIQYNNAIQSQQYEPYYSVAQSEDYEDGQTVNFQKVMTNMPAAAKPVAENLKNSRLDRDAKLEQPSLSSYAVYKTDYKADIEENVITVKGNVFFEVFKKGWTQIPLVRNSVGLIDVSINRGASFVTMQQGKYFLMIDKPGRYTLDIEFLLKAQRERENGPGSFSFDVISSPISQFEFTMPETGVEIFVEPSIRLELKKDLKKTVAWAIMPNTENITVRWTKALPKEEITPVQLEPKLYVDTSTYSSIGEGLVRSYSTLNYSILQSEISTLRIALPDDVSVLEVKGANIRDWKVSHKEGLQYLDVYLSFVTKGNYVLNINYERKIGEGSIVAQIPWVRAMGVEREKGYFGLAAATNVELAVNKLEQASLIDVRELPSSIWSSTSSPILLAFKYVNHPFNIAIEVTKHQELPVLVAAIDSVEYSTLYTNEGKSLTKAIYQVRNNVKQFIHLNMPSRATVWSVFVAGKPVKPAKDKNGSILVPLEKSKLSGEDLTQFPVEIVYISQEKNMKLAGSLQLSLPRTDIPVNSLLWNVYFPNEYIYFNFGGDVQQIKKNEYKQSPGFGYFSRGIEGRLADQYSQTSSEQWSGAQVKGVLPIKINVPQEGKHMQFSKLLVTDQESPMLSLNFIKVFKPIRLLFKLLVFAVVIFVFVTIFKKVTKK